jgi:hypothetical protein
LNNFVRLGLGAVLRVGGASTDSSLLGNFGLGHIKPAAISSLRNAARRNRKKWE